MKVIERIKKSNGNPMFSFEIIPPLKGNDIQTIYNSIDPLLPFNPSFINVTYHREEFTYKQREKGYLEKISMRKRPGTVAICAAIYNKYKIDTVPHLICGGFNKEETENALIDLQFLGIRNVLALRGDPIKTESHFLPTQGGHSYAVELVSQIASMNKGVYLDEDIKGATPTDFSIGVAGYPEKHFESPNMAVDMKYLKDKIDAGAEYIITQLFFDNQKFFKFVEKCREYGIHVPILPGIKPITQLKHITFMPKFFHVELPETLTHELLKCKSDQQVMQTGVDWAVQQSRELLAAGMPGIHYFTMGRSEAVSQILKQAW
ncbi:MAG: methylenetetrahydrofolate reductase [NAD(P)H] [Candidatus Competibacteraceae bacterium]|nr:methylenetetrahydrofolate reductase [NAD(P)H] [Candidatus Competibacteraceae bacterium]